MSRLSVKTMLGTLLVLSAMVNAEPLAGSENLYEKTGGAKFDSLNVRFVGNWPFGPSFAVAYDSARSLVFCGSGGGVYILDVSDPSSPVKVSDIRTRGVVWGLFYDSSSERLYIADYDAGLGIWDVSTPSSPAKLGSYDTPGYAMGVTVSGSYAYVADWHYGLRVIDITDPSNPVEVGYYDTPGYAMSVAVSGSYAYVADGGAGLQIYENLLIGVDESQDVVSFPRFRLLQNPVTGDCVELELSLKEEESYDIGLYNLVGQKVRSFSIRGLSAGDHKIRLQTEGLSGGVYFMRIRGKKDQQFIKVTIVK